jgi:hypothetical protein
MISIVARNKHGKCIVNRACVTASIGSFISSPKYAIRKEVNIVRGINTTQQRALR